MKKLSFLLAIVLLFTCVPAFAASSFDYEYLDDGTLEITGYHGKAADVVIPETIYSRTVTSIREGAFYGMNITSLVIPANIINIGYSAFAECYYLESVEFDGSYLDIGEYAFMNDISLSSIIINEASLYIGKSAFENCTSLSYAEVLPTLAELSIRDRAFSDCKKLPSFMIPNTATEVNIAKTAFRNSCKPTYYKPEEVYGIPARISVYAECADYNHVGNDWYGEFYVNGVLLEDYLDVYLKAGDVLSLQAVIGEKDALYSDEGVLDDELTIYKKDLKKDFTVTDYVTVTENDGIYYGYSCVWTVVFTFEIMK